MRLKGLFPAQASYDAFHIAENLRREHAPCLPRTQIHHPARGCSIAAGSRQEIAGARSVPLRAETLKTTSFQQIRNFLHLKETSTAKRAFPNVKNGVRYGYSFALEIELSCTQGHGIKPP